MAGYWWAGNKACWEPKGFLERLAWDKASLPVREIVLEG